MTLNKDAFADNHVRFIAGKPKKLKLFAVRQEQQTIQGNVVETLVFGVNEEDGKPVEKEFSITSKKLANAMWKIAEKVDQVNVVEIKTTKFGSGYDTYYEFCEIIGGKETQVISTEKKV